MGAVRSGPTARGVAVSFVHVSRPVDDVAVITLERPDRLNAMAFEVIVPYREALEEVRADNGVRAVVVTGAGGAFCSGADLQDPGMPPEADGLRLSGIALRSMEALEAAVATMRRMRQPVIAAVDGPAIGGGFCLALAADLRVASSTATFRAAGISNGLTANELGISWLLPRAIGSTRSFELLLTGRVVEAEEALAIGLVNRVVGDAEVVPAALELAASITRHSQVGVELTKRLAWGGLESPSLDRTMDNEGIAQLYVRVTTKNFEEAVAARAEGRDPVFRD